MKFIAVRALVAFAFCGILVTGCGGGGAKIQSTTTAATTTTGQELLDQDTAYKQGIIGKTDYDMGRRNRTYSNATTNNRDNEVKHVEYPGGLV